MRAASTRATYCASEVPTSTFSTQCGKNAGSRFDHPDAVAAKVRDAQREWQLLDKVEAGSGRLGGLARRFHAACRAAIEGVKHRAPIWKQEHYIDGDSVWSEGCSLCEQPPGAADAGHAHAHAHTHGAHG